MCRPGYKHTAETRAKIGAKSFGRKWSDENRKKQRERMLGVKRLLGHRHSEEAKKKMSLARTGSKRSEETKKKMGAWQLGRKLPEETKRKIREGRTGEKHWNWKGGARKEEYTLDWTDTLRRSIRERDKYTCQICSEQQGDRAFSVHHIDYDKKNGNPNNLITLCVSCHCKTNYNRKYWQDRLTNLVERK